MDERRPERLRLFDILDMVAVCERALRDVSREAFYDNLMLVLAVERALEIISEASRHVSESSKAKEPGVDWDRIAAFGNFARHAYDLMEADRVYDVAKSRLGELKSACQRLYQDVKHPTDPWPDAG